MKTKAFTRIIAPKLNIAELEEIGAFYYNDEPNVIYVEAQAKPKEGVPCPVCGSLNTIKHGWARDRYIHDISQGVNKIDILLHVGRYRCKEPQCGGTFSQRYDFVENNRTMTKRLVEKIQQDSLTHSFSTIAQEYGITIPTVESIFDNYCAELEKERECPVAPRVLGVDENHIADRMRGVLIDVETGCLLEITKDRTMPYMERAIRSLKDYEDIEIVTMDMYTGYKTVVKKVLPKAEIIIDKFHVVQNLQRGVDSARKELTRVLKVQVKGIDDELERYRKESLLVRMGKSSYLFKYNSDTLKTRRGNASLMAELCEVFPEINELRILKEKAEDIYRAYTLEEAEKALDEWIKAIPKKDPVYEKMRSTARSAKKLKKEILNYFDCGYYTNATTEGINSLIKFINNVGRGYKFETLRYKVIFYPGAHKRTVVKRNRPVIPEVIDEEDVVNMLQDGLISIQKAISLIKKHGLDMGRYRQIRADRNKIIMGFTMIGDFTIPERSKRTRPPISPAITEGYEIDPNKFNLSGEDLF